jgi:hypothetical protein
MWVQRTPDEMTKWHMAAAREARMSGLLVAGLSWLGITAILSGGWMASRWGVVAQDSVAAGSFCSRFPMFAVAGLPIAFWLFRRESRKELERSAQMTICPKCETAGESNAEAVCDCGGRFVLQSNVRWIDGPESE